MYTPPQSRTTSTSPLAQPSVGRSNGGTQSDKTSTPEATKNSSVSILPHPSTLPAHHDPLRHSRYDTNAPPPTSFHYAHSLQPMTLPPPRLLERHERVAPMHPLEVPPPGFGPVRHVRTYSPHPPRSSTSRTEDPFAVQQPPPIGPSRSTSYRPYPPPAHLRHYRLEGRAPQGNIPTPSHYPGPSAPGSTRPELHAIRDDRDPPYATFSGPRWESFGYPQVGQQRREDPTPSAAGLGYIPVPSSSARADEQTYARSSLGLQRSIEGESSIDPTQLSCGPALETNKKAARKTRKYRPRKSRAKGAGPNDYASPREPSTLAQVIGEDPMPICERYLMESGKLLLDKIYEKFEADFPVLRTTSAEVTNLWKGKIRTALSAKERFIHTPRASDDHGLGGYYSLDLTRPGNRPRNRQNGNIEADRAHERAPSPPATGPHRSPDNRPRSHSENVEAEQAHERPPSPPVTGSFMDTVLVHRTLPRVPGMPSLLSPDEIFRSTLTSSTRPDHHRIVDQWAYPSNLGAIPGSSGIRPPVPLSSATPGRLWSPNMRGRERHHREPPQHITNIYHPLQAAHSTEQRNMLGGSHLPSATVDVKGKGKARAISDDEDG